MYFPQGRAVVGAVWRAPPGLFWRGMWLQKEAFQKRRTPENHLRRCPEVPDEDSVPLTGLLGSPGKMFVNQDQNKLVGQLRGLQTGVGKGFAN